MERMFVDPATGDLHPESYYHRENIDLATVMEYIEVDGSFGFDIQVENIERMDIRAPEVFAIFAHFVSAILEQSMQADDEERETLQGIAAYVSKVMMKKMGNEQSSH